jgi:STE24 endopeptidase
VGRCLLVAGCASLVRLVAATTLVVAGFALVRGTPWWPVLVGVAAGAALVLAGALYPLVAAPLVDRAVPLADAALDARITALADRAGLGRVTVLVARSDTARGEGAYIAGFGPARRLVLSAGVLHGPASGVDAVVAHELGHWSLRHQRHALALTGLVLASQLALVWLVTVRGAPLAATPADARLLPLVLLVALVAGAAGRLLLAARSRHHERAADAFASALLHDPAAVSAHLRRVVLDAGADLQPTAWRRLLSSHPPPAERLAAASSAPGGQGAHVSSQPLVAERAAPGPPVREHGDRRHGDPVHHHTPFDQA